MAIQITPPAAAAKAKKRGQVLAEAAGAITREADKDWENANKIHLFQVVMVTLSLKERRETACQEETEPDLWEWALKQDGEQVIVQAPVYLVIETRLPAEKAGLKLKVALARDGVQAEEDKDTISRSSFPDTSGA